MNGYGGYGGCGGYGGYGGCGGCCATTGGTGDACGCRTAEPANPPGRTELVFGRSSYGPALARMRDRLSAADLPALRGLTARRTDGPLDPALGLLDAWACVGHVISFYDDRLVAEHYLRTCRQRRSAVELARLVGYAPRPGVAADAWLAFTLDDLDPQADLVVPTGTRAYTQPGPGETMQPFETTEALGGRPAWSVLRPRLTAPQVVGPGTTTLWLDGITTGLTAGDTLLLELRGEHLRRTVAVVHPLPDESRTRVDLEAVPVPPAARPAVGVDAGVLQGLLRPGARQPAAPDRFTPRPEDVFTDGSYAGYGLLTGAYPGLEALDAALAGTAHADATGEVVVRAMRVRAGLHGHNASLIPWWFDHEAGVVTEYREWDLDGTGADDGGGVILLRLDGEEPAEGEELHRAGRDAALTLPGDAAARLDPRELALDAVHDGILPGSLVALEPEHDPDEAEVFTVTAVRTTSRTAFNLPARVTVLTLDRDWRDPERADRGPRTVVVHARDERLALTTVAVTDDVCGTVVELDGYVPGLQPGRRLVVTGERTDVAGEVPGTAATATVTGVHGTEIVLVAAVAHRSPDGGAAGGGAAGGGTAGGGAVAVGVAGDADPPAAASTDTVHTVLTLAEPGLQYCYRRPTVQILGNVAHATHGESRVETLGGGDATRPLQSFGLKQGPLTYVPAATTTGVRSTLEVRVEDLRWQEAPHAAAVRPGERRYVLRTDDDGRTTVTTGMGARLPTGPDNVRALYRSGLGAVGNVRTGQVSVLASRPTGVTAVTNPLRTTGGADRDDLDAVRRRAPVGLAALDRLVSAADLEDFTRAFAGIGKARVLHPAAGSAYRLVVAAEDDAPLTPGSTLLTTLRRSLVRYGGLHDPGGGQPLETRGTPAATVDVQVRTALLVAVRARVRLAPDHGWETVLPRLRAALHGRFGFAARELGQVPYPGEAMAVLQGVRGVAWVDLLAFGTLGTGTAQAPASPAEVTQAAHALLAGAGPGLPPDPVVADDEIAYLSLTAPGTVLLELDEVPT